MATIWTLHEEVATHASDAQGRHLAHWTGRMHQYAGHLTE
jgi:hypothetical protein